MNRGVSVIIWSSICLSFKLTVADNRYEERPPLIEASLL